MKESTVMAKFEFKEKAVAQKKGELFKNTQKIKGSRLIMKEGYPLLKLSKDKAITLSPEKKDEPKKDPIEHKFTPP